MGATDAELRNEIERRRERISGTLEAIGDRMSPGRMAQRRKAAVTSAFGRAREAVMGTADDAEARLAGATDRVEQSAHAAGEAVRRAPQAVARQSQGNPIAAGLIAFGAGMLLAAVLPKTETEQHAAEQLQPQLREAVATARDAGRDLADTAKAEAQQAAIDLRETARDATTHVSDQAKSSAEEVKATTANAANVEQ